MSGLPLKLILFNVLINGLHNMLECVLIKFIKTQNLGECYDEGVRSHLKQPYWAGEMD